MGTDETPFLLAHGTEVVIWVEVVIPILHSKLANSSLTHLYYNLDMIDVKREQAQVKLATYY